MISKSSLFFVDNKIRRIRPVKPYDRYKELNGKVGVELKYTDLVRYLIKDKEQHELLKMLAEKRGLSLKEIVRRGIFAVPDEDELDYLLEQWGLTFEDAFDRDIGDVRLFKEGFIIPILDSRRRVTFFINYNWERDKSRQYFNVFPGNLYDLDVEVKMYGAHNLDQGIKEGWIVVVEGIFDAIVLESEGIPAVALLGSKLLDYTKIFLSRFEQVIYIPDGDFAGNKGWKNMYYGLDNVFKFELDGTYKDVNDYALSGGIEYKQWLNKLKRYRRK